GSPVTFTATVLPAGATGTVTFFDGATQLGSAVMLSGGTASSGPISNLTGGAHNITATYSGDSNFATATSPNFVETINNVPSTTAVTSPTTTSVFGTTVTFTATVTPAGATGSVVFMSGGSAISGMVALVGGSAMFTTTAGMPLPTGMDQVTAVYSGDSTFNTSTSPAFTETVTPDTTTTTLTVSPSMNSTVGVGLTFTATVAPGTAGNPAPTGTVTFFDDTGSGPMALGAPVALAAGSAMSPVISNLGVGMHNITAVYTPAANYTTSTSAPLVETIAPGMGTPTVSSSMPSAPFNTPLTFTVTVGSTGPVPTGMVTLLDGMTMIAGPAPLVGGSASFPGISNLTVGMHDITATYSGDASYQPGTSPILVQDITLGVTSTSVNSPVNNVNFGTAVIFTANVTPAIGGGPAVTGMVTFFNNGVPLGSSMVNGLGMGMFNAMLLPVGTDMITAVYSGDTNYAGSTSTVFNENVGVGGSSIMLSTSQSTIALGGPVIFTANVQPMSATGTVSFFDNGVSISPAVPLTGAGVATFGTTSVPLGMQNITAVYSGDVNFGTATSNTVVEDVIPTSSSVTLSASLNSIAVGASVTFTAIVAAPNLTLPTPTGTVTFTEDGTNVLGVVTLVNGVAMLNSSTLALGNDTIVATYNGDPNFSGGNSNAVNVTVAPLTSNTSVTTLT